MYFETSLNTTTAADIDPRVMERTLYSVLLSRTGAPQVVCVTFLVAESKMLEVVGTRLDCFHRRTKKLSNST
jgi:hypothetical protein